MNKISYALNRQSKPMNGSTILFLGVAYKADIDDARESPALLVMEECAKKRSNVLYYDPYIPEVVDEHGKKWTATALTDELLESADCVVFTTAHSCFNVEHIVEKAKLIVDLKNVVRIFGKNSNKIVRL